MNSFKAACIQMEITDCKKDVNISKALLMAEAALSKGAEILVFPEVFSTGFCYEYMDKCAETGNGTTVDRMREFSKKHGCVLVFSIIEKEIAQEKIEYYNLGICIEDGEIAGTYRKTHPFKREKQYFSPGNEIHPVKLKNRQLTIGLQICYELRFPEVARKLVLEGSDILVTIAEFPAPRGNIWKSLVIARAIENQIPHIACNRVGNSADSSFFGGSLIVDGLGEIKAEAKNAESVICCEVKSGKSLEIRDDIPVFKDRRPELY